MPKGAIHYTGSNFSRVCRLDIVQRVNKLIKQQIMLKPRWLTAAQRSPPLELFNLHLRSRRVHNKYIDLSRELLQRYPDIRFQDCFVHGNDIRKGVDNFRVDHPAMQFLSSQLKLMNAGKSKRDAFQQTEEKYRERREELERQQKLHMAAAVAAAAAADPAAAAAPAAATSTTSAAAAPAAAAAAIASTSTPLTTAEGSGLVQPMFTSGKAYWKLRVAQSKEEHLQHIRNVLRELRERAEDKEEKYKNIKTNYKNKNNYQHQRAFAYIHKTLKARENI